MFENKKDTIVKIDTTTLQCQSSYFDYSILADTLKHLVNVKAIIGNLKEITFLQTEINVDSLKNIYHKYARQYDEDWGKIYSNYCLDRYIQEEAINQFKVMTAFEHALKSLSIKDEDSEFLWNEFNAQFMQYLDLSNPARHNQVELEAFSEVYLKLNSSAWYAYQIGYSYIDPYIVKIKEYLINDLEKYTCPISFDYDSIRYAQRLMYHLSKIEDERIAQMFISNQECLSENASYFWFPVRYLEHNHHQELLHITLWKLLKEDPEYHIDYKISHLHRNLENRKYLIEQIHLAILEGSEAAMMFAIKISSKEILKTLKKAKLKHRNNDRLKEVIDSTIDKVENRIIAQKD